MPPTVPLDEVVPRLSALRIHDLILCVPQAAEEHRGIADAAGIPLDDSQVEMPWMPVGPPHEDGWAEWWATAALTPMMSLAPWPDGPRPPPGAWTDDVAWTAVSEAIMQYRSMTPYVDMLMAGGERLVTAAGGGYMLGPDLVVLPSAVSKAALPTGTWTAFRGLARYEGGRETEAEAGPRIAFQREGSVIPTLGPPRTAPGELVLVVSVGGEQTRRMADGTVIALTTDSLEVRGPTRDVVAIADGVPVMKVFDSDVRIDLRLAALLRKEVLKDPDFAQKGDFIWIDFAKMVEASEREAAQGLHHAYDIQPNPPAAGESCSVRMTSREIVASADVIWRTDSREGVAEMRLIGDGSWEARIPGQPEGAVVRYSIEGDLDGKRVRATDAGPALTYPTPATPYVRPPRDGFSYAVGEPVLPVWVRDSVIYHVLVDRFAPPAGGALIPPDEHGFLSFAGGTIRSVIDHLDHVQAVGADTIWLSPIFRAEMNLCYDVRDLFDVDPRIGTLEDVRDLCAEMHRHGLRILLDLEVSYLGARHPFVESAKTDPGSPYREWFFSDSEGRPFGWFSSPILVAVDHANRDARQHLLEAARFWLDLGFDGYRLDSAHAASLDFWTDFGVTVRSAKPDTFTVGEDTRPMSDCLRYRGRLDASLDFEFCGLSREVFATGRAPLSALDQVMRARDEMPPGFLGVTFVENHDMPRISTLAAGDDRRVLLALMFLLTTPGPPVLYYGTEVGIREKPSGQSISDNRMPMLWGSDQDASMLDEVSRLVSARRSSAALSRGTRRTVAVDDETGLYAYSRRERHEQVLVVLNASNGDRKFAEATTGEAIVSVGRTRINATEIELGPYSGVAIRTSA